MLPTTKKGNQETPLIRCRKKHTQILFGTQEWIQRKEWPQVLWWKTSTGTRGGMEDCIFVSKVVVLKFGGFYMKSSIPNGCLTSCGREWSSVSVNIPVSSKIFFPSWVPSVVWSTLPLNALPPVAFWMMPRSQVVYQEWLCVAKRTFVSSLEVLVAVSIGTCATAKDQFLQSRNTFFHRKSRVVWGWKRKNFWVHADATTPQPGLEEIRTRFSSRFMWWKLLALAVLDETYLEYNKVV